MGDRVCTRGEERYRDDRQDLLHHLLLSYSHRSERHQFESLIRIQLAALCVARVCMHLPQAELLAPDSRPLFWIPREPQVVPMVTSFELS